VGHSLVTVAGNVANSNTSLFAYIKSDVVEPSARLLNQLDGFGELGNYFSTDRDLFSNQDVTALSSLEDLLVSRINTRLIEVREHLTSLLQVGVFEVLIPVESSCIHNSYLRLSTLYHNFYLLLSL
jgi:hypothetical protein